MADISITVLMCSKEVPYTPVSHDTPRTSLQVSLEKRSNGLYNTMQVCTVQTPLKQLPGPGVDDCQGSRTIEVPLMRSGMSDLEIIECLWPDPADLEWVRGVVNKVPNPYITIDWTNPQDNCADCLWYSSTIVGRNPHTGLAVLPFLVRSFRLPIPGEIPTVSIESDWSAPLKSNDIHNETQPNVVPGEEICLYWAMKIKGRIYEALMASRWFDTPLLTGGTIVSVNDQNKVTQTWTVDVNGVEVAGVIPSDFANYNIGSWVQLLKQEGPSALISERHEDYTYDADNILPVRCVPLDFQGVKDVTGDLETKEYDMTSNFRKGFELCYHNGIITSVDGSSDEADVDVEIVAADGSVSTKSFSGVEIFYHCDDSDDTTNGRDAFSEDDTVILLDENYLGPIGVEDLTIIGHTDKLVPCAPQLAYTSLGDYCFVWDLLANTYATGIPTDSGGIAVFPCLKSSISVWKLANTFIGNSAIYKPIDLVPDPHSTDTTHLVPGIPDYTPPDYSGTCWEAKALLDYTGDTSYPNKYSSQDHRVWGTVYKPPPDPIPGGEIGEGYTRVTGDVYTDVFISQTLVGGSVQMSTNVIANKTQHNSNSIKLTHGVCGRYEWGSHERLTNFTLDFTDPWGVVVSDSYVSEHYLLNNREEDGAGLPTGGDETISTVELYDGSRLEVRGTHGGEQSPWMIVVDLVKLWHRIVDTSGTVTLEGSTPQWAVFTQHHATDAALLNPFNTTENPNLTSAVMELSEISEITGACSFTYLV